MDANDSPGWFEDALADGWHGHRLRVRYGETDQMGVVHHANYLLYMEDGRTRLMESLGCLYAQLERDGIGMPVRKTSLRFRAPAKYDEELVVLSRVERLGGASLSFRYRVCSASGVLMAEGTTELACVDLANPQRPPKMIPDDLRALLEPRR